MSTQPTEDRTFSRWLIEYIAHKAERDATKAAQDEVLAIARQHIHPQLEAALEAACAEYGIDWTALLVHATCECLNPGTRH